MATWNEIAVSDQRMVMAAGGGISIAFFRHLDRSGWVMMRPSGDVPFEFDQYRPPVLIVAGQTPFDLALIKSISEKHFSPTQPPKFVGEKDMISARIWHGSPSEGLGFFGHMINGCDLTVFVYRSDYDAMKIELPLDSADLMRRVLLS